MRPDDNERDYEVGYGKPPRHTRFKKGQSGNPRGRPKESKNLATLLKEALNEHVIVAENGGRRKITMRESVIQPLPFGGPSGHVCLSGPAALTAIFTGCGCRRSSRCPGRTPRTRRARCPQTTHHDQAAAT
jgi:hypothetical protein